MLDARVRTGHADAWAVEGALRAPYGGGAATLPGHPADGLGTAARSVERRRRHRPRAPTSKARDGSRRARRAVGRARARRDGVACRPPTCSRLPLMGLPARDLVRPGEVEGLTIRPAGPDDLETVLTVDTTAFGSDPDEYRGWTEPHLDAPAITVALASLDEGAGRHRLRAAERRCRRAGRLPRRHRRARARAPPWHRGRHQRLAARWARSPTAPVSSHLHPGLRRRRAGLHPARIHPRRGARHLRRSIGASSPARLRWSGPDRDNPRQGYATFLPSLGSRGRTWAGEPLSPTETRAGPRSFGAAAGSLSVLAGARPARSARARRSMVEVGASSTSSPTGRTRQMPPSPSTTSRLRRPSEPLGRAIVQCRVPSSSRCWEIRRDLRRRVVAVRLPASDHDRHRAGRGAGSRDGPGRDAG